MMGVRRVTLIWSLLFVLAGLAACAGNGGQATASPVPDPTEMQPSEDPTESAQQQPTEGGAMVRGNVFIDNAELQVMESYPVQLSLSLEGNLPTPCHQLAYEVSGAGEPGDIQVEVWSEAPADQECIQVLEPFEENISLGTATEGSFSVFLNGEEVGSVDL